ncbi:hypothetical protein VT06_07610 [Arsukibacterium sp. MJ3]|uniref:hypothetical protein n=1 Tax=Arsukibacterium sp. MJ3 TaxID=1632859 RepID=UPI00062715DC|nr:hypothetical protein [Arsukibacterium sp. MJ3]KKO49106.1 hypothetical protein VT06_07610 [Arsukibacterium sp. MJ3]
MFWQVTFWILVALIVLPFPFKVFEYVSGKDKSPRIVKVEEVANALFMALCLVAFYGFIAGKAYLTPAFWQGWLFIAIVWSLLPIFWSPKLVYAAEVMGKNKMRLVAGVSCILYLPLLFAVYFYAF